ncbi:MAG: hypothetical protein FJX76_12950 [Armatimonadetes bacterium]|nr:hypothetical protein [Armatimonadota bacterium]
MNSVREEVAGLTAPSESGQPALRLAEERAEEPDLPRQQAAVILGLLIMVTVLLCANTWSLSRFQPLVPALGTGEAPPHDAAASPVPHDAGASPAAQAAAHDPGQSYPDAVNLVDPFDDLFLHDLVSGILVLKTNGSSLLRPTEEQLAALKLLEGRICRRLESTNRRPGEVDRAVRQLLTYQQKLEIRRLRAAGIVKMTDMRKLSRELRVLLKGRKLE